MMIFIGYPARMLKSVLPAVKGMETVVLGNMSMKDATFSLPDASLNQYQKNLESLIGEL
jgi:CO dehydrogenase/acetyl-CoA synthase epsilon subunit